MGNYKNGDYIFIRIQESNGYIDSTFGIGGYSIGDLFSLGTSFETSILTSNGNILSFTERPNNFAIFDSSGSYIINSIDESCDSFETNKYSLYPMSPKLKLNNLNNIVLASSCSKEISGSQTSGYILAYFNEKGILDTSINSGKIFFYPDFSSYNHNSNTVIEDNGNILFSDYTQGNISRFHKDLTIDSSFGTNGVYVLPNSLFIDDISTVIKVKDGSYYLSGNKQSNIILLKLTSNGILDNTFNGSGYKIIDYNSQSDYIILNSISLAQDSITDKLILSFNTSSFNNNIKSVTYRLNLNGSIDNSFGVNGKTLLRDADGILGLKKIHIQSNGKILLLFNKYVNNIPHPYIVRLNGNLISEVNTNLRGDKIVFYPNPTKNYLFLNTNLPSESKIKIYNSLGVICYEDIISTQQGNQTLTFNISSLESGVYFVEFHLTNKIISSKFVKQ
ncbi:MAG: T9SS type A sorting domain-containing protein [Chitinophagales bacterium]|nr:T9SS type A sorting domain-containing protein [Chitinophagales bacterium]